MDATTMPTTLLMIYLTEHDLVKAHGQNYHQLMHEYDQRMGRLMEKVIPAETKPARN